MLWKVQSITQNHYHHLITRDVEQGRFMRAGLFYNLLIKRKMWMQKAPHCTQIYLYRENAFEEQPSQSPRISKVRQ